jgi:ribonucleoside-diphosphate reductase beta chain
MMSLDLSEENIPITELHNISVDKVLNQMDQSMVYLPSYRELYYRWERQQWSTQDLDFIFDRVHWEDLLPEEQNDFIAALATFYQGEACVTDALGPYILAVPDEEMRIFLTTQLVDEARHTVFFDRVFKDVLEIDHGRLEDTLAMTRHYMNKGAQFVLLDSLSDIAERMRKDPRDLKLLIEGVVLYHLVVEGMMGLAGQKTLLDQYRLENIFPAIRAGLMGVTRDESRHVLFGVRFLRDMLAQDANHAQVIEAALNKYGPGAIEALTPPVERIEILRSQNEDPWKSPRYARESLRKKLKVIGLNIDLAFLPTVPAL